MAEKKSDLVETRKFEVGDFVISDGIVLHSAGDPPDKTVLPSLDSLSKISSADDLHLSHERGSYVVNDRDVGLRDSLAFESEASLYSEKDHCPAFDIHQGFSEDKNRQRVFCFV